MRYRIYEVIEEKGMKKGYVAEQIGVDRTTLRKWQTKMSEPPFYKMVMLSEVLGVPLEELYEV